MVNREQAMREIVRMQVRAAECQVAQKAGIPLHQLHEFEIFKNDDVLEPEKKLPGDKVNVVAAIGEMLMHDPFHKALFQMCSLNEMGELDRESTMTMIAKGDNEGRQLFILACQCLITSLEDGNVSFCTDYGEYSYSTGDIPKIERLVSKIHWISEES
jgi:hypothetical protein